MTPASHIRKKKAFFATWESWAWQETLGEGEPYREVGTPSAITDLIHTPRKKVANFSLFCLGMLTHIFFGYSSCIIACFAVNLISDLSKKKGIHKDIILALVSPTQHLSSLSYLSCCLVSTGAAGIFLLPVLLLQNFVSNKGTNQ